MCQKEAEFALRAFSALLRSASSAGVLTRAIAWMRGAQKRTQAAAGWTLRVRSSGAEGPVMAAKSSAASVLKLRPERAQEAQACCDTRAGAGAGYSQG